MAAHTFQALQLDQGLQPCAAEWGLCPAAARVLAVGTYQLDEATQQRHGRLLIYGLREAAAAGAAAGAPPAQLQLEQLSSVDLPGIFDLRWHPCSAMPQLAAALADGSVRLASFGAEPAAGGAAAAPSLTQLPAGGEPASGMAVSLDYSRAPSCAGEQLVVSYSSGQLQLFQVRQEPGSQRCSAALHSGLRSAPAFGAAQRPDMRTALAPSGQPTSSAMQHLPLTRTAGNARRHGQPGHLAGTQPRGLGRRHRLLAPLAAALGRG